MDQKNLFDFCQLTVNRGINWKKTDLEEIKNNLQFQVISHDPLTITRGGLSEDIFVKLAKTLRNCSMSGPQSEDWEFIISSQFETLKIKDDSEQVKEELSLVSNSPSSSCNKTALIQPDTNINLTPSKEKENLNCEKYKSNNVTLGYEYSPPKEELNYPEGCKEPLNAHDFEHIATSETEINLERLESSKSSNERVTSFDTLFQKSSQCLVVERGQDSKANAPQNILNYCQETEKSDQTNQSDHVNSSFNCRVLIDGGKIILPKILDDDFSHTIENEMQNQGEQADKVDEKEGTEVDSKNLNLKDVTCITLVQKVLDITTEIPNQEEQADIVDENEENEVNTNTISVKDVSCVTLEQKVLELDITTEIPNQEEQADIIVDENKENEVNINTVSVKDVSCVTLEQKVLELDITTEIPNQEEQADIIVDENKENEVNINTVSVKDVSCVTLEQKVLELDITTEIPNQELQADIFKENEENEVNTNIISVKDVSCVTLEQKVLELEETPLKSIEAEKTVRKNNNSSSENLSQNIVETSQKNIAKSNSCRKEKNQAKCPMDDLQNIFATDHTNISNGESSLCEKKVQIIFNKKDFKAVRYYFKDQILKKYLDESKYENNKHVIDFNERKIPKEDFENLQHFKTSLFDNVRESEASEWQKSIKDKFPKIKTVSKLKKKLFHIMGHKDDVRAATSMILNLRGNNDDEMMWQKNSEETKDTSSNSIESENKTSAFSTAKSVPKKYNDPRDKHFDLSSKDFFYGTEDKMIANNQATNPSLKLKEDEWKVSPFKQSGLESEKFEGKSLRTIERSSKEPIYLGNNLRVNVCKADITKLDVDMIVNAANIHLAHKGGVASAIAKAAGSKLQKECEDFITKHKALEVTGLFVSSGGNLKARKVMHAVGPKWDYYEDKTECLQDLRHTVLRCLVEASRQGARNIAFPSISAAIFKVPPDSCAENYMAAVKHFDCIKEELQLRGPTSLQEIMFVDVNDVLVNIIQKEFSTHWKDDPDKKQLKKDLIFSQQHLDKQNSTANTNTSSQDLGAKPKEFRQSSSSSGTMGAKATEKGQTYKHESLKINVSVKPALISANEVVIVVGEPFKNISGAEDFDLTKHLQEDRSEGVLKNKNIKVFRSVYKSSSRIRHVCCLNCNTSNKEEMEKAFKYLASMDMCILSDQKLYTLVITSKILFNGKIKKDFKLVKTFAELLHKYIQQVSTNKILKGIRIATSEDALPNIIKVFDSREDLEAVENDMNWKTSEPNQGGSSSSRLYDDHRSPAMGNSAVKHISEQVYSSTTHVNSYNSTQGNQLQGEMYVRYFIYPHPSGYAQSGAWEIIYYFPFLQKMHHTYTEKPHSGITRHAYLPDTDEHYDVLIRLKIAFMRCLTFTIGNSLTQNGIRWNGIHHKTSLNGGRNGYPDPTYLRRVAQQLTDRGVTFESILPNEQHELQTFIQALQAERSKPNYWNQPVYF